MEHLALQTAAHDREIRRHIEAEVQSKVEERVRATTEKNRAALERSFATREKKLQSTVQKLEEQKKEMSRRIERLSPGERGEFTEDELLAELVRAFPEDDVQKTRRGQRGADIFQRVRFRTDGGSTEAGLIIYECKDTAQWSNSFITQVKAEAKHHGTRYAVLVSRCFPRGKTTLAVIDGVVVVDPARLVTLTTIMRRMVIESHLAGAVAGSRTEKTAELFRFISSTEFRQTFDSLSEDVAALAAQLAGERRDHERAWTQRSHRYGNIGEMLTRVDTRFKCILEGKYPGATVHPLHKTSA